MEIDLCNYDAEDTLNLSHVVNSCGRTVDTVNKSYLYVNSQMPNEFQVESLCVRDFVKHGRSLNKLDTTFACLKVRTIKKSHAKKSNRVLLSDSTGSVMGKFIEQSTIADDLSFVSSIEYEVIGSYVEEEANACMNFISMLQLDNKTTNQVNGTGNSSTQQDIEMKNYESGNMFKTEGIEIGYIGLTTNEYKLLKTIWKSDRKQGVDLSKAIGLSMSKFQQTTSIENLLDNGHIYRKKMPSIYFAA